MTGRPESKLGTFSTLSIGIGGMVGGGIFAVTGLTIELTEGAAPVAFLIAGMVALLTSYSYLKLTLRFPSEGGTVAFLNQAFGGGVATGSLNILLLLSYVVLLSVYAYAFGSYGASFFPKTEQDFWLHVLISSSIIGLLLINVVAASSVIRSENFFNIVKMVLLGIFVVVGLATPMDWSRLARDQYVAPLPLVAGAMLIFLNYEGFELIANAAKDVATPKRSLPIAYVGGVLLVMVLYMLIVTVVVGHMSFREVNEVRDSALSAAAQSFMGRPGYIGIAVAALMATSSAINATLYGTGRLAYIVAKTGELPAELERPNSRRALRGCSDYRVGCLVRCERRSTRRDRHDGKRGLPNRLHGGQHRRCQARRRDGRPTVAVRSCRAEYRRCARDSLRASVEGPSDAQSFLDSRRDDFALNRDRGRLPPHQRPPYRRHLGGQSSAASRRGG